MHKREEAKKELQNALRNSPDSTKIKEAFKELKAINKMKSDSDDLFRAGNHAKALDSYRALEAKLENNKKFLAVV